jgi:mRNA degradation ribonuclease J1/J2
VIKMNAGVYVEVDSQIKNKYRVEYMIKYAVQIGRKARIYDSSYYNDIYIAKYVELSLKKYRELINSQYRMNDITYFKTFEECQEAVDKLYYNDESVGSLTLYPNVAAFPAVGEPTAIYVDESTNKMYRWVASKLKYIPIGDGDSAPDIHFINGGGAFDE